MFLPIFGSGPPTSRVLWGGRGGRSLRPAGANRGHAQTTGGHATKWLHNERMADSLDKVFKALADRGRRRLLDRLRDHNGQTLTELCAHLPMSRQAVTKHLQILQRASLVATLWRGREKLHYLNPVPIYELSQRWIGKYERGRLRVLAELKKTLEGDSDD